MKRLRVVSQEPPHSEARANPSYLAPLKPAQSCLLLKNYAHEGVRWSSTFKPLFWVLGFFDLFVFSLSHLKSSQCRWFWTPCAPLSHLARLLIPRARCRELCSHSRRDGISLWGISQLLLVSNASLASSLFLLPFRERNDFSSAKRSHYHHVKEPVPTNRSRNFWWFQKSFDSC